MHRTVLVLAALVGVSQLTACTAVWAQAIGDRTTDDLLALKSYKGRLVEEGLVPGKPEAKVVREIVYQKPWKTRAEVIEPAERKGDLVLYDGERLVFWWPSEKVGIQVRGIPQPDPDQVRDAVVREVDVALHEYAFSLIGEYEVAGQPTTRWKVMPTGEDPHRRTHYTWVHGKYSFPVKMTFYEPGGALSYGMEFDDLEIGVPVERDDFAFTFPKSAVVFDWDVSKPGVSLAAAREACNFDVLVPSHLPEGHSVQKVVMGEHELPMVAVVANQGATWISLTQNRHYGGAFELALGKVVTLREGVSAYLNFVGAYSVLSWVQGDTHLTLIGNVSYPELIKIAASVK